MIHQDENFEIPHQRLLAMMRAIDNNRNGKINFAEFKRFAESVVVELEVEEEQQTDKSMLSVAAATRAALRFSRPLVAQPGLEEQGEDEGLEEQGEDELLVPAFSKVVV
jgi:hypothetical protein